MALPRSRFLLSLLGVLFLAAAQGARAADSGQTASIEHELSRYVVSPATFGRKDLYTWTRPEQIAELRAGKELLSRSVSATGEPPRFDLILADKAYDALPLAVALRDPRLAKKRFAWAAAWPTVMGWEKETYGDQLLQITLKDDAIIMAFTPFGTVKFECRDALGNSLDEAYVLAHPEKIAAVYFCAVRPGIRTERWFDTTQPVRKEGRINYREYVVCNEAMIASWQYGSVEVKRELAAEIVFLESLKKYLQTARQTRNSYSFFRADAYSTVQLQGLRQIYAYSIAFPNDFYLMNADRIATIIATLQAALAAQGAPITH